MASEVEIPGRSAEQLASCRTAVAVPAVFTRLAAGDGCKVTWNGALGIRNFEVMLP